MTPELKLTQELFSTPEFFSTPVLGLITRATISFPPRRPKIIHVYMGKMICADQNSTVVLMICFLPIRYGIEEVALLVQRRSFI